MAKIGRNAQHPCGSGKKYKKCCMMKRQSESLTRSLVHRKTDELIPQMLEYVKNQCPEDTLLDAWEDFCGLETGFEDTPYKDLFIRWFLSLWIPEEAEDGYETAVLNPALF